jgi:hypothetical protein
VDFNYDDTSGEVRDQRAEHEVRLAVFMNALEDDFSRKREISRNYPSMSTGSMLAL